MAMAFISRKPSPAFAANISPISTPSRLSEKPSRRADASDGMMAGTSTVNAACVGVSRSARAVRRNAGGSCRTAFMVMRATGISPCMAPNATFAGSPRPNDSSTSGYSVTFGSEYRLTSTGSMTAPAVRPRPSARPMPTPAAMETATAMPSAFSVAATCTQNSARPSSSASVASVSPGDARVTPPAAQCSACHANRAPNASSARSPRRAPAFTDAAGPAAAGPMPATRRSPPSPR